MSRIKNYFAKKSKLGIAIDVAILTFLIFLAIPGTRKDAAALLLKPTLILHQPKVKKEKPVVAPTSYDWQLRTLEGKPVVLNAMADKVLFINLWATWCSPCLAEMPDLQALYEDYGDRVSFLFITNEKTAMVKEFMAEKEYSLPVFVPVTNYPAAFETNTLPTTFIVNKKGEIVVHHTGLAKWNSQRVRNVLDILIQQ